MFFNLPGVFVLCEDRLNFLKIGKKASKLAYGWMDGWMDGWMMDGWINGWIWIEKNLRGIRWRSTKLRLGFNPAIIVVEGAIIITTRLC